MWVQACAELDDRARDVIASVHRVGFLPEPPDSIEVSMMKIEEWIYGGGR